MSGIGSVGSAVGSGASYQPETLDSQELAGDAGLQAVLDGAAAIGHGARGETVTTLQQALTRLGHPLPQYGADGKFGDETAGAVSGFQRSASLPETGEVDGATLRAMDQRLQDGVAVGPDVLHGRFAQDSTFSAVARGEQTLAHGSRGDAVRLLQRELNEQGYPVGSADGVYGDKTLAGVSAFQANTPGLQETGVLDGPTLLALDSAAVSGGGGLTPPAVEPAGPSRLTDPSLDAVAAGEAVLDTSSENEGVRQVQESLDALGFKLPVHGADGDFGGETVHAVKAFQLEVGLPETGTVDSATLEALRAVAPPPGQVLERAPDYGALYEDGRLDMTIAIGYDEGGAAPGETLEVMRGLQAQGYQVIQPEAMTPDERAELGLTPQRYTPGATYMHHRFEDPSTGQPVDAVVRLITPDSASDPASVRGMFENALEHDEVVVYSGHARYGTGPDFDDIHSGEGNFVINEEGNPPGHPDRPPSYLQDAVRGRDSDLTATGSPGKYQLLYFSACSTENYLPNLRSRFPGRDNSNTDIVATTIPTWVATGSDHALGFVTGVTSRQSMNAIGDTINGNERAQSVAFGVTGRKLRTNDGTIRESGFLDNPGNRYVAAPN